MRGDATNLVSTLGCGVLHWKRIATALRIEPIVPAVRGKHTRLASPPSAFDVRAAFPPTCPIRVDGVPLAGAGMVAPVDRLQPLGVDTRIDLRRGDTGVPQQLLDHPQVDSVREQVRGEAVP